MNGNEDSLSDVIDEIDHPDEWETYMEMRSFINNNNNNEILDDDNEEDDDESSYEYDDDDAEVIGGWLHDYNNFNIELTKNEPVDEFLKEVFEEEIRHINNTVMHLTNNGDLNEIINIFIEPLIKVIVRASNASAVSGSERVNIQDAVHFIRCLIAMHIYRVTPSTFFQKTDLYPLANKLNKIQWKKVFYRLQQKQHSINKDSEIFWDKPFTEDTSIREGEDAMARVNRQFFLPDISIFSTDDDHLRLSSSECEDIGLPRKNNPKKAIGPVSTGIVSLTSGLTLANRIAGRGESDVDTIQILCQQLFNKPLAN